MNHPSSNIYDKAAVEVLLTANICFNDALEMVYTASNMGEGLVDFDPEYPRERKINTKKQTIKPIKTNNKCVF